MNTSYTAREEARLLRSARENPFRILHGAVGIDSRVLHGRNAAARDHDALGYGTSPAEEEKNKKEDIRRNDAIIQAMVVGTVTSSKPSWEAFDWSQPVVRHPMVMVRDKKTGQGIYMDDGLSCSRIPETGTSVAKVLDTTPTNILNAEAKFVARNFGDVAQGAHLNPFAAIETYRPGDVPAYMQTTIGTDLSRHPKTTSFATFSDGQTFTPVDGIEGGFNAVAQKTPAPKIQVIDYAGPALDLGIASRPAANSPAFSIFGS